MMGRKRKRRRRLKITVELGGTSVEANGCAVCAPLCEIEGWPFRERVAGGGGGWSMQHQRHQPRRSAPQAVEDGHYRRHFHSRFSFASSVSVSRDYSFFPPYLTVVLSASSFLLLSLTLSSLLVQYTEYALTDSTAPLVPSLCYQPFLHSVLRTISLRLFSTLQDPRNDVLRTY